MQRPFLAVPPAPRLRGQALPWLCVRGFVQHACIKRLLCAWPLALVLGDTRVLGGGGTAASARALRGHLGAHAPRVSE